MSRLPAFLLILIISAVCAFSVNAVSCPNSVTQSMRLSYDVSCPNGGPRLDMVDIVFDCNGHVISGGGRGVGITMTADRTTVKNCVVQGFENGIVMKGLARATVSGSSVGENEVGVLVDRVHDARVTKSRLVLNRVAAIKATSSRLTSLENTFAGNGQDVMESDPITAPKEPENTGVEQPIVESLPQPSGDGSIQVPPVPQVVVFENKVSERLLVDFKIDQQLHAKASKAVHVQKAVRVEPDDLVFLTIVSATASIPELVLYESIPSSIAPTFREVSSTWPHDIVGYEPVLARFFIGQLLKGQQVQIEYRVARSSSPPFEEYPVSIAVQESPQAWRMSWWLPVLFVIFTIMSAAWLFEAVLASMNGVGVRVIILIGIAVLFVSLDLGWFVVVSRPIHQAVAAVMLFFSSIYLGVNTWLLWLKNKARSK